MALSDGEWQQDVPLALDAQTAKGIEATTEVVDDCFHHHADYPELAYQATFDFCDWCPGPEGSRIVSDIEALVTVDSTLYRRRGDENLCSAVGCHIPAIPGTRGKLVSNAEFEAVIGKLESHPPTTSAGTHHIVRTPSEASEETSSFAQSEQLPERRRKGRDPIKRRAQVREASKRFRERRKNRIEFLEGEVERLQREVEHTKREKDILKEVLSMIVGNDPVTPHHGASCSPYELIIRARREFEIVKKRCLPLMLELAKEIDEIQMKHIDRRLIGPAAFDVVREKEFLISKMTLEVEYAEDRFIASLRDICAKMTPDKSEAMDNSQESKWTHYHENLCIHSDEALSVHHGQNINRTKREGSSAVIVERIITLDEEAFFVPSIIYRSCCFPLVRTSMIDHHGIWTQPKTSTQMPLLRQASPRPLVERIGEERMAIILKTVADSRELLREKLENRLPRGERAVPAIIDVLTLIRRHVLDQLRAQEKTELFLWGTFGIDAVSEVR